MFSLKNFIFNWVEPVFGWAGIHVFTTKYALFGCLLVYMWLVFCFRQLRLFPFYSSLTVTASRVNGSRWQNVEPQLHLVVSFTWLSLDTELLFLTSQCFWYLTTWSHSMLFSTIYHKTYRCYENNWVSSRMRMFKLCMMLSMLNTSCSSTFFYFLVHLWWMEVDKLLTKSYIYFCVFFRKFQGAMQIVAMAETVVWACFEFAALSLYTHTHLYFWQIYMNMDNSSQNYWLRLLIREWAQFCIFLYIG